MKRHSGQGCRNKAPSSMSVFWLALPTAAEAVKVAAAGVVNAAHALANDSEDAGAEVMLRRDLRLLRLYAREVRALCRLYFGKEVTSRPDGVNTEHWN